MPSASHPPALLRIVERSLREECGLAAGDRLLLAVSGGGDSTALLHVMAQLAPRFGLGLYAHGVDHGLRVEASAELDLVAGHARDFGVEFSRTQVQVEHGSNLQSRAREARYAALQARAYELGGALIVTAHHADDRAETVMIRLLRGAGVAGLGVLPARAGQRVRPMIRARRSDIHSHLERHELAFATDPSNRNQHYLRVRVRQVILPALCECSPALVEHLCALADEAVARRVASGEGEQSQCIETSRMGKRQSLALARAIELGQVGFELPLRKGLLLRLERDLRHPAAHLK
ncbi:MAG TPA: tRNA lysidine(34) synthetase TilS [Polyangiaceae bacterium]